MRKLPDNRFSFYLWEPTTDTVTVAGYAYLVVCTAGMQ